MKNLEKLREIRRRLCGGAAFSRIAVPEAQSAPSPVAFILGFPVLVVPLAKPYAVECCQGGRPAELVLNPGEALFVPPNCWTRPLWRTGSVSLTVLFGKRQFGLSLVRVVRAGRAGGEPLLESWKHHVPATADAALSRMLEALPAMDWTRPDDVHAHLLKAVLLHALGRLDTPAQPGHGRAHQLYESVCAHMQQHYRETLTRQGVAAAFGVTPSHLSRVFRTQGSMKLWDYVTLVRIDRAKLLLTQYRLPVKQVAAQCGFEDASYFCRVFRKRCQLTPEQYRERYTHCDGPAEK